MNSYAHRWNATRKKQVTEEVHQRRVRSSHLNHSASLLAFSCILWMASSIVSAAEATGPAALAQRQVSVADSSAQVPPQALIAPILRVPVSDGERLSVRRITTADGLSQTRVGQIVQDDRGFIWLGTQYGLNRYDGYDFKVFVHQPGVVNSLSGAYIFSLFKDRDGILWIGCNSTLDRLDPRTETFTHYSVDPEHANIGGPVFHISQDRHGALWLATGTGLHRLDPLTGVLTHYTHTVTDPQSLSTVDVKWSGEDREGHLWVGTADGLDEFDPNTGKVQLHIPVPDPFKVSLYEDRKGRFWVIRATGVGLALYDRASKVLTPISFYSHEPSPESISGVQDIQEDAQGQLWIASMGEGLLRYDPDRRHFVRYRNHPEDPNSIAEDDITTLFRDRDGNFWLGFRLGSNVFRPVEPLFESYKHYGDDPASLSSDSVSAIYDDSEGSLWIGTENGAEQIDRRTRKRIRTLTGDGATTPLVVAITENPKGLLWIGTFTQGLTSYDLRSGRYVHYRHKTGDPRSLSSDTVHVFFCDHAGNLWVGTDDGLNRFDPETNSFKVFKRDARSKSGQRYIAIAEDASGILWLGTHNSGLHRFDPGTGSIEVYKPDPANPGSLRDAMTPSVHVGAQGIIWVATQDGLNRFDSRAGVFEAFDTSNGLPGNLIDCILEDRRGNLWLSTNNGLSRFNIESRTFVNYTTADGMPGNDLTGWSACSANNKGELFFGGFSGAVAFAPEKLIESPATSHLLLTDFLLSGVSAPVGPEQVLNHSIAYTDGVTLTHEQRAFSVTFADLQYAHPELTRYRYKLEGLDSDWYDVGGGSRRATFTTLPAGKYVLRVQAHNARADWNQPGIMFNIMVLPPWWATWWIRIVYAVLVVFAAWFAYRLRLRRFVQQLQMRMEERINERTRIAHELHDTLLQGLLSASLQLAVADEALAPVSPAKGLVNRVSQMLQVMIVESRNTVQGLRVTRAEDLERAIANIPRDLGSNGLISISVVAEGRRKLLRAGVRDEVYWIARESITNALRHSNGSIVRITLHYLEDGFRLSVRDDGCGIDSQILKTGRENHFGLVGMTERARGIRGTLSVASAPDAGTEVLLTLSAAAAFDKT